jgi:hypothetical protein
MAVKTWHIAGGALLLYALCKAGKLPVGICNIFAGGFGSGLGLGPGGTGGSGSGNDIEAAEDGSGLGGTQPGTAGGSGGTTGSGGGYCATLLHVPFYAQWMPGTKQAFLGTVYFDEQYSYGGEIYYRGEALGGNWSGYKVSAKHSVLCQLMNDLKVSYQAA